jgi:hypothetical protein
LVFALGLRGARAEEAEITLSVARALGSEHCPGAEQIFAAAGRLFPGAGVRPATSGSEHRLQASVSIRPAPVGHEALLEMRGAQSGERRIADPDAQCRGLADALAVALVVSSTHQDTSERPELEPELPPTLAPSEPEAEPWRAGAEASGLLGLGTLEEPSLGGAIGVSLWAPFNVGVKLRALRAVARSKPLAPGETQVDLWAALLSGCYRIGHEQRFWLSPCADFGWGRQHAEARRLRAQNGDAARRWLVVGPSLSAAVPIGLGLSAGATLGLPVRLHDQSYSVDGSVVQRQSAVGGYALLGLTAEWPLSAATSAP